MAPPVDLAEFRLLRALRAGAAGAPFTQLWNAQAGAVWSVFRAMVERDADAVGWMASFRLDLQERCAAFRADEAIAPQMGRALYAHAAADFPASGPLPAGPLPPDERGVRELPPATRLAYLVDLFFDWAPPDPHLRAAHRLLEPNDDTDARLLVYTALLQNPPGESKILPPGALPEPPHLRRAPAGAFTLGLLMALALGAWTLANLPPNTTRVPGAALPAGLSLEGHEPSRLTRELEAAGVPARLAACPDLSALGLTLRAAQVEADGVELRYVGLGTDWTLRHETGPAAGAGTGVDLETHGATSRARWRGPGGQWTLASDAPAAEVLAVAQQAVGTIAPNAVPSPAP